MNRSSRVDYTSEQIYIQIQIYINIQYYCMHYGITGTFCLSKWNFIKNRRTAFIFHKALINKCKWVSHSKSFHPGTIKLKMLRDCICNALCIQIPPTKRSRRKLSLARGLIKSGRLGFTSMWLIQALRHWAESGLPRASRILTIIQLLSDVSALCTSLHANPRPRTSKWITDKSKTTECSDDSYMHLLGIIMAWQQTSVVMKKFLWHWNDISDTKVVHFILLGYTSSSPDCQQ